MEKADLSFRQQVQKNFKCLAFRKESIIIVAIAAICLCNGAMCLAATGTVNCSSVHQELYGFGASGAWYDGWLTAHPQKAVLYDILFRDLGLDIYRIRNCYAYDSLTDTKTVVQAAMVRNPSLKIMGTAWSPAAYLKSNNDISSVLSPSTLKKDANDPNNAAPYYYAYNAYAKWWADGLAAYESNGIHMDYISIQNECEFETSYDSCKFMPTETSNYAGYDKAFEAVYQELNSTLGPNMPKMLAPETMGFGNAIAYINALTDINHVYGYAHHLYSDGSYDSPDAFIAGMTNFGSLYGYKPLFQTEYERLASPSDDFTAAMNMALHIHNSLVYEGVNSYFHWCLFWEGTSGLVSMPSYRNPGYTINPTYYIFKHYAKFTDPNWFVIDATASPSTNLRMTAFKNPDGNELTIVIINKSTAQESLKLTLKYFSPDSSEIYRSTSGSYWSYIGAFNPSTILVLPQQSITTIHLTGLYLYIPGMGNATKCTVKAGKTQAQDRTDELNMKDSFAASGTFIGLPNYNDINHIDVDITSLADDASIYTETLDCTSADIVRGKLKYSYRIPKYEAGKVTAMSINFSKGTFAITAKNVDLTGLACPLRLEITMGDFTLSADADETIVNGKKTLIPTRLIRMYDDKLVVTRAKVKNSAKEGGDSLSVKGGIAVKAISNTDMDEPNLVNEDVNVIWGSQTFVIPAHGFKAAKTGHSYKCSKAAADANFGDAGKVTATIDLDKSTYTISVSEANLVNLNGIVSFGLRFADFNEVNDVNVARGY